MNWVWETPFSDIVPSFPYLRRKGFLALAVFYQRRLFVPLSFARQQTVLSRGSDRELHTEVSNHQIKSAPSSFVKLRHANCQPLNSIRSPNRPLALSLYSPYRINHVHLSNRESSYPVALRGNRQPIRALPAAIAPIRQPTVLALDAPSFGSYPSHRNYISTKHADAKIDPAKHRPSKLRCAARSALWTGLLRPAHASGAAMLCNDRSGGDDIFGLRSTNVEVGCFRGSARGECRCGCTGEGT